MAENYTFELVGREPKNIEMIRDALFDIKESTFQNLYDAQKALARMDRYDFVYDSSKEYSNISITEYKCVFLINKSLIMPENRIIYRRSEYYHRTVSLDTINTEQNIFNRSILVFINGLLYTDVRIKASEDFTEITFPFKSVTALSSITKSDFINSLFVDGGKLTVIFLPQYDQSSRSESTKTIATRGSFVIPNLSGHTNEEPILCYQRNIDTVGYTLFDIDRQTDNTINIPVTLTHVTEDPTSQLRDKWNSNTTTTYKSLYLSNKLQKVVIQNDKYFELPVLDMPVPLDNILLFKKTEDGEMQFVHNASELKLHYPTIYELTNQTGSDTYIAYVHYENDTATVHTYYKDELALYKRFFSIIDSYNQNSISNYIRNYSPVSMTYDIDDYTSSSELYTDPIHYQFSKLKEMIYKDGDTYKFYLDRLVGYVPQYYINAAQLDMPSRLRTDNHAEISTTSDQVTFDEPCYLFIVRIGGELDHCMIWVDNRYYRPKYVNAIGMIKFIYIPTRLIDPDKSIITIEQFTDFYYTETFTPVENEYKKISTKSPNEIIPNDIFLSYIADDGKEKYIDKKDYKLFYLVDGSYSEITEGGSFYKYADIYIKILNTTYIGNPVTININRVSFTIKNQNTNEFQITRKINNDRSNFLLFKNGQVVPNQALQILFSENVSGPHDVKILLASTEDTDKFTLYYTTNKYYQVYYQDTIPSHGYLNLTGKLSKPLDFKWYDIYLNGLRLTERNVEFVGPYMMIISGLTTCKNLVIYQRNLDPFISFMDPELNDDQTDNLIENNPDLKEELETGDLDDTDPDILDDLIIDYIGFFDKYLSLIGLINPDKQQITENMLTDFPAVFDTNQNLFINPDVKLRTENGIFLNPDTDGVTVI